MSIPSESGAGEGAEEQAQEEEEEEEEGNRAPAGPAHHPVAPADESFDILTTVDPSYVISLIRKILPADGRGSGKSSRPDSYDAFTQESMADGMGKTSITRSHKFDTLMGNDEGDDGRPSKAHGSMEEDVWEECGCILWDLAANQTHAEFMVQNLALEVLLANLMISHSVRATEICLGIIGNLACHEVSRKHIASTNSLISVIVDQLFLDDTACLCEACRVITSGLQGAERVSWAEALQPENILSRALWIAENALNPQLIEKILGLLLAILENEREIVTVLLPNMMKLGFPSLLVNLLTFEMGRLTRERATDRYTVLDLILRVIEALSVMDDHSQEVCSSKELFQLLTNLIKLPDKFELASSCVTAVVLFANILTDSADLVLEISRDISLFQGLFDIFPFSSDDREAQNALWSVTARLLVRVCESNMDFSTLHQYVSVLVGKADVIEDDLLDHHLDSCDAGSKLSARSTALEKIVSILSHWTSSKASDRESLTGEECINRRSVDRLLEHCSEYLRANTGPDVMD